MGYRLTFNHELDLSRKLTSTELKELENFCYAEHDEDGAVSRYCPFKPGSSTIATGYCNALKIEETSCDRDKIIAWFNVLLEKFFNPWDVLVVGSSQYEGSGWGDTGWLDVTNNVITIQSDEELENENNTKILDLTMALNKANELLVKYRPDVETSTEEERKEFDDVFEIINKVLVVSE